MDKESVFLLQQLDCNCNDCKFMVRDMVRFNESAEFHYKMCLTDFENTKRNLLRHADEWDNKNEPDKANVLRNQANRMRFQFSKKDECTLQFGNCHKLNKAVSFIPGVCQIETQGCFVHRHQEIFND